ncbi:hypothetical protein G6F60_013182 [Rhizopus arrhizus]|nr:hypothetical protein G6F60_013182 [Rhizopus arrhizus]
MSVTSVVLPAAGRQQQQRAFRGMAGRCGLAGHAVNPQTGPAAGGCAFGRLRSSASQAKRPHPWGLDGAIHGANGPAHPHRPTSDRFQSPLVGVDLGRHGRSTLCVDAFRFQFEIFDSDGDSSTHGVDLLQIAEICRRRGGSGCGGVRGMDAAAKPPRTGLRPAGTTRSLLARNELHDAGEIQLAAAGLVIHRVQVAGHFAQRDRGADTHRRFHRQAHVLQHQIAAETAAVATRGRRIFQHARPRVAHFGGPAAAGADRHHLRQHLREQPVCQEQCDGLAR